MPSMMASKSQRGKSFIGAFLVYLGGFRIILMGMVIRKICLSDTLIFSKPNQDHLCNLRAILLCFEAISKLKINLSKSEIVPVGAI